MTARALLIVDVQRGFISADTAHIPGIVQALQHDYEHVYVTRFINPDPSPFRSLLDWHRFGAGTADTALAFEPRGDATVIDKSGYSAATPALLDGFARLRIEDVDLCGIETDACVLLTAVALVEAGIRGTVLPDACASLGGPEFHAYGLALAGRMAALPASALTAAHSFLPHTTQHDPASGASS